MALLVVGDLDLVPEAILVEEVPQDREQDPDLQDVPGLPPDPDLDLQLVDIQGPDRDDLCLCFWKKKYIDKSVIRSRSR